MNLCRSLYIYIRIYIYIYIYYKYTCIHIYLCLYLHLSIYIYNAYSLTAFCFYAQTTNSTKDVEIAVDPLDLLWYETFYVVSGVA